MFTPARRSPVTKSLFEVQPSKIVLVRRGQRIIGTGSDPDLVSLRTLHIRVTMGGSQSGYIASASATANGPVLWTGTALTIEKALYRCVEATIKGRKDKR